MRFSLALICFAAVWLGLVSLVGPSQAQTSGQPAAGRPSANRAPAEPGPTNRAPAVPAGYRLLGLKEGQAIAEGIAWADDEEGLAPDCSHLVHTLYQRAGYPYPYASSVDLFLGTGSFLRVRTAQPGDLIVWRGHVGIVMSPRNHSFFSSVTAGTQIQDYRSTYWQARGYPRFYRYLTKSPLKSDGGTVEAAGRSGQPSKQAVLGLTENQPSLRAVKTASATTASKVRGEHTPDKSRAENSSQTHSWPILTTAKEPRATDVTATLETANLEASEILRAANLEKLERPVVVYRQLQVSSVELNGKRGTAEIQLETVAALTPERMASQPGREDHQLELQRTNNGWTMVQGNEIAYVPRDRAMRVLAERLAALTKSPERSTQKDREQADIVRFMNLLIE
jgi:NlpC/P60 family